jgi:hypothetical protein
MIEEYETDQSHEEELPAPARLRPSSIHEAIAPNIPAVTRKVVAMDSPCD